MFAGSGMRVNGTLPYPDLLIGRVKVYVSGEQRLAIGHFFQSEVGSLSEHHFRHEAFMSGGKMLHEDNCKAESTGQCLQQSQSQQS